MASPPSRASKISLASPSRYAARGDRADPGNVTCSGTPLAGISVAASSPPSSRAANAAALQVYQTLRAEGTQKNVVDIMQSRMDLYDYLGYHDFEQKLDQLFEAEELN